MNSSSMTKPRCGMSSVAISTTTQNRIKSEGHRDPADSSVDAAARPSGASVMGWIEIAVIHGGVTIGNPKPAGPDPPLLGARL